jgi:hypothetical protein
MRCKIIHMLVLVGLLHAYGLVAVQAFVNPSTIIETLFNIGSHGVDKKAQSLFAQYKGKPSQTEAHFIRYAAKKLHFLRMHLWNGNALSAFENDPVLRQVIHDIIAIEKREAQKGNYTFVHGQPWELHFFEELYTFLWQTVTGVPVKDFFFLRFKHFYFDSIAQFKNKLDKHKKKHAHYLKYGTNGYYTHSTHGHTNQNYLMFLNYALFNNQFGSSSARYIAKGDSENGISKYLWVSNMFTYLGLDEYYQQFAFELEQLKNEHRGLTQQTQQTYGHPLVISINPHMLDKVVYISWAGEKEQFGLQDGTTTQDVKYVLNLLRTDPYALADESSGQYIHSDRNEFALILSLDGALKPNNGICMYSVPPVERHAWQSYCKKRDALFTRMKESILAQKYGIIDKGYWQSVLKILY